MKKYYFLCGFFLLCSFSLTFSQWETVGNFERLTASATLIRQYVVCDSTRSIYVLDTSYVLKRIDIETGQVVWSRNLRNINYPEGQFVAARIGYEGKNYAILLQQPNAYNKFTTYIKGINTDSLIGKLNYEVPGISYYGGYVASFNVNIDLSERYLFVLLTYDAIIVKGSEHGGSISIYRIEKDSVIFYKSGNYGVSSRIEYYPFRDIVVRKFLNYLYHWAPENSNITNYRDYGEFSLFDIGKGTWFVITQLLDVYTIFSNEQVVRDRKYDVGDTIASIKLFSLSSDPSLVWIRYRDLIRLYDTVFRKDIRVIKYPDNFSDMINSLRKDLLLLSSGKSIHLLISKTLEPLDTIVTPASGNIGDLKFSSDEEYLYFSSGNAIYRMKANFKEIPPKVYFFLNPKQTLVGKTVEFLNYSVGDFDEFFWEFGDGQTSKERQPKHIYLNYGKFRVVLRGRKGNQTFVAEDTVIVSPNLKADFHYVVDQTVCRVFVRFENTSIGAYDSVLWDFGDGTKSQETNPIHYYNLGGKYKVSLTIKGLNNTSSITKEITIDVPPALPLSEGFKNEVILGNNQRNDVLSALIGPNGTIVAIIELLQYSPAAFIIVGVDQTGKLLWNYNTNLIKMVKNPYSNNFITFAGPNINVYDYEGKLLKTFVDTGRGTITNVVFFDGKIYYSSFNNNFKIGTDYPPPFGDRIHYILYFTVLDTNFNLISRQELEDTMFDIPSGGNAYVCYNFYYFAFPKSEGNPIYFLTTYFEFLNGKVVNYSPGIIYEHLSDTSILKLNGVLCSDDFTMINCNCSSFGSIKAMKLLNDSTLVILTSPSHLTVVNVNSYVFKTYYYPFIEPLDLLKLNDTAFVVPAHSLSNKEIGFAVFNHKGEVLDTFFIQCRYGKFMSITPTPENDLLLAGGRQTEKDKFFSYSVFTDLPRIRNLFALPESKVKEVNEQRFNVAPNPTSGKFSLHLEPTQGRIKIELFDFIGNLLKVLFEGNYNKDILNFDISELPQSLYFLKISQSDSIKVLKIIKIGA